jgi:hypothetical protein
MGTVAGYAISLALAYALFSAGEFLLWRRARGLREGNQSFLVGASAAATALFPLSLIVPRWALAVELWTLIAAAGARLFCGRLLPARSPAPAVPGGPLRRDPAAWVGLAMLLAATAQFALYNHHRGLMWDGYQIWATKALVLHTQGGLTKDLLVPRQPDRLTAYPPMVPLLEALLARLRGGFDWDSLKPVFLLLFVSLVLSTYQAARELAPRPMALAAAMIVSLLPPVSTRFAAGGYADMPQAALVAGMLAALLGGPPAGRGTFRDPAAWLMAGLITVKNEGAVLLFCACAAVVFHLAAGRERLVGRLRAWGGAVGVVAAGLALRRLYVWWVAAPEPQFGPYDAAGFNRAIGRLWDVARLCLGHAFAASEWGLFWAAFLLAAVILAAGRAPRRELATALGVLLAATAYASIFLFTNWPLETHIILAWDRLLVHLTPAASIVLAAAFRRLWDP